MSPTQYHPGPPDRAAGLGGAEMVLPTEMLIAARETTSRAVGSSEHQLHRELHGSRAADLIQRIEPAVHAASSKAVCQRLTRLTKQGAG